MIFWQALKIRSDFWLIEWTKEKRDNNWYYYGIYCTIGLSSSFLISFKGFILTCATVSCSRPIFHKMITSLIRAPMNLFHETVPKGQILNRLSSDINAVDNDLSSYYGSAFENLFPYI